MLEFTPTHGSLHKVLHQLHLSSGNNAEMGFKWCLHQILALHTGMKFISNDCRGKREPAYTQSGLPVESTRTGTFSSLVLEPECYVSQEHHEHDVQVVTDPLTSARGSLAHRQKTPGQTVWISEELSWSLYFTNLIKLISVDRLTSYLLP